MRRVAFVFLIALLTLLPLTLAAQALPPHKFFGSASSGSPALLNGGAAADGATVIAVNQDGQAVGRGLVTNGTWAVDVDPLSAQAVYFVIGASSGSARYAVEVGGFTEVALSLSGSDSNATVASRPGWEQYTIQAGDTLLTIARRFELTLEEVLERNPQINDAHIIQSGQVLFLRQLRSTDVVAAAPSQEPVSALSGPSGPSELDLANALQSDLAAPVPLDAADVIDGDGPSTTLLLIAGLVILLVGSFGAWWRRASRRDAVSDQADVHKEVPSLAGDPSEEEPVWHVENRTGIAASVPPQPSVADRMDAQLD